jgi:transcriptional regulator with XRE-family HTH domain
MAEQPLTDPEHDGKKPYEELGHRLKLARDRAGMTQKELGAAVGVDAMTISRYERGIHRPDNDVIQRIAGVLRERSGWFFEAASPDLSEGRSTPDLLGSIAGDVTESQRATAEVAEELRKTRRDLEVWRKQIVERIGKLEVELLRRLDEPENRGRRRA